MKHWVEFLPDAGSITKDARPIISLQKEIENLSKKILQIESEISIRESEILKSVKSEWTAAEILKAREKAANQ